jgi:predicted nucleotidyltransferase
MKVKVREGDLLETADNILFGVKGLVHPLNRAVAFPRYVPDPDGDRERDGMKYRKVYALSERYALLEKAFPQYLVYNPVFNENLCEVPVEAVKQHHQPTHRLRDLRHKDVLDEVERTALRFVDILKENAEVPWSKLGISGSILVRLHTPTSDVDPIVYGSQTCHRVYSTLRQMLEDRKSLLKPYSLEELQELFDFRSKDTITSFEDFFRTDSRKALQGKFMGRDYFVRFVKDWNEVEEKYGTILYKPVDYAKIKAKIVDDSEAIFTPCCYKIENVEILEGPHVEPLEEIVSFRGRFCEQAKSGEVVIAQGKVERLQREEYLEHFRLLLGNKISDYMILAL